VRLRSAGFYLCRGDGASQTRGPKALSLQGVYYDTVFVIDKNNIPLIPCSEKRANQLLSKNQAAVLRKAPFTIKLLDYAPPPGQIPGC
jgi:hypothetical protein